MVCQFVFKQFNEMKIYSTFLMLLLFACQTTEEKTAHSADKHQHATHHDANEFMHQSSTEELINRFESAERDAYQQPEKVLAWMGDFTGEKIMDLGAGSGYFSVKLARAGAQVIAADVDTAFQKHIQARMQADSLENIELRLIPYDDPMLADGEVDKVLVVNTYHHIQDRVAYFQKVKTGLTAEGELLIVDYFVRELPVGPPPEHKVSAEVVQKELAEAGFQSVEKTDNLLEYQYLIRARK